MDLLDLGRTQGTSTEAVRDVNRRLVLNLIRTRHPISRADLARLSGLQRSTISLIVEQLVAEEWVTEGPTGRLPRGRRPTFLRLNDDRVIVGVDIRPSGTTVALANINGEFTSREVVPTPSDPDRAVKELIGRIQEILATCKGKKVEGIGISLPGRVSPETGRLIFAPNLQWRDLDLRQPIEVATGLQVEMENAANACVLASVWFDRRDPGQNLVVLTVSEGIGAGLCMNGQLVRGLGNMAGEFGHIPMDPNGPVCTCGGRGCWEMFGSNRAALRYYQQSGAKAETMRFEDLLDIADQSSRAKKALHKMAEHLGRGLAMLVTGLAPDRILVVGELTRSWDLFEPVLKEQVQARALPGAPLPEILPTHEQGLARLRGTVALVLHKHFGMPRAMSIPRVSSAAFG